MCFQAWLKYLLEFSTHGAFWNYYYYPTSETTSGGKQLSSWEPDTQNRCYSSTGSEILLDGIWHMLHRCVSSSRSRQEAGFCSESQGLLPRGEPVPPGPDKLFVCAFIFIFLQNVALKETVTKEFSHVSPANRVHVRHTALDQGSATCSSLKLRPKLTRDYKFCFLYPQQKRQALSVFMSICLQICDQWYKEWNVLIESC